MHPQALFASAAAAEQFHVRGGYVEYLGQEPYQVPVCPAFDRRGGDADLETIAVGVDDFVAVCTRLNVQGKYQIGFLPATPARQRSAYGRSHMPSAANNGTTRRRSTSSPRMASSGERSNPLIGGSNRRAGRSTGSVSECSRLTAGL